MATESTRRAPSAVRGPRLRIVAVNDVYTLENLPRLRGLVEACATKDPADRLLVTLAGDFVSPSLLSSLDAGRAMIDCMNAVGFTHVTFGNHEDDVTLTELRHRVEELKARWLATNVRGFTPKLPTSDVVSVTAPGGRTVDVGLVGVVMNDPAVYRRCPFGASEVTEPNASALEEAKRLVAAGAAVVLPLTHQGADADRALAAAPMDPPFPVLIGGHEHVKLLEHVGATYIVKAGADAVLAAVIDLAWPSEAPSAGRDVPEVSVRLEEVARFPEDAALRARVDRHMRRVAELQGAALMKLGPGEALSSVGTRAHQTSLGALLCSRVRDTLEAEVCIFNGGGIRASRTYESRFTYGDLETEVPFDNEVVVTELPGAVLRDAIAASRARAPLEYGGFLQVDDRAVVDERTHELTRVDGEPLDEAKDYRVALVREMLAGLDHNEPLERFAHEHPDRVPPPGSGREIKLVLVEAFSLALWHRLGGFDAVDTDGDGVVTAQEIAGAVARFTDEAPSPVTADLLLRTLDTNHDQGVSREEAAAAEERAKRGAKQR